MDEYFVFVRSERIIQVMIIRLEGEFDFEQQIYFIELNFIYEMKNVVVVVLILVDNKNKVVVLLRVLNLLDNDVCLK